MPAPRTSASSSGPREKRSNTGSRSCIACPILLIESAFGWRSSPFASKASSSKKQRTVEPEPRKYSSARSFSSAAENTPLATLGSKASTISAARARNSAIAAADLKPSITAKPSVSRCSCSAPIVFIVLRLFAVRTESLDGVGGKRRVDGLLGRNVAFDQAPALIRREVFAQRCNVELAVGVRAGRHDVA